MVFKPYDYFDIIDYNGVFADLQKPESKSKYTFAHLKELFDKNKEQFLTNYRKNIKSLYRRPESFPLDKLFNPVGADDEIESPSTIIPAIDPISMLPLEDACRTGECKHIACLNKSSFTDVCPLCNSKCHGTVFMDILTQRLITFARRQCHGQ